jgi:hypothetical protein
MPVACFTIFAKAQTSKPGPQAMSRRDLSASRFGQVDDAAEKIVVSNRSGVREGCGLARELIEDHIVVRGLHFSEC